MDAQLKFAQVMHVSLALTCVNEGRGHCDWFQDSIDLFLGNFAVDDSDGPTPLRVQKDWKFLTVSVLTTVFCCHQQQRL